MRTPFKAILTLAALVVVPLSAGLTMSGCKKGTDANATQIVIGHVASKNGGQATFGVSADEGVTLALEEINAAGGVLGKTVVVKTEDDRSDNSEAKTAAQKLITRDKVVALLGEISSSRSLQIADEAQGSGVPMLSPGSTADNVTQKGDYVFRSCFTDSFQGSVMVRFAMEDLKLKTFAILVPRNSAYGTGLQEIVRGNVQRRGGTVLIEESYEEDKDTDFKSQLTKIRGTKPEAIFVTGYYGEAGLIAKQARELGITVPMIAADGWDSDKTLSVGESAVDGCYFTNHYAPDEGRPEVDAFVAAYKKRFNKVPDAMAVLGYDSMKLMADAIKRAGSTDKKAIRDALAATKDFPGVAGKITIDANRNAAKSIVVVKIEDRKFKYLKRFDPQ